jgi:hypothetical protein
MLPLLFSANDRSRNGKRGNYAGDKSRMHLQEFLRENSVGRGYEAQTAMQFFQSNTQQMPGRSGLLVPHRNQPVSFSSG